MRPEWTLARRVVVKIGSALLVDRGTGALRADWLATLIDDVTVLKARGADVILVSSGAIALGRKVLGLGTGALRLEESQAAAAVGQVHLAAAYESQFRARAIKTAQVLLTVGDTEQRRRYLNARNTMQTLLGFGVIPVVNENDTVATTEIRYGDNDRLAARVASMCNADCLVLLSDIDGLYTAPPQKDPTATRLDVVTDITPEIEAMAGDVGSELSRGGMITKIQAAKIAVAAGCHMAITSGKVFHPLAQLSTNAPATWFLARGNPAQAYKRWISGSLQARGVVTVDDGAVAALMAGKSLLPAGVVGLDGQFERGDAVVIRDLSGHEVGRGLVAYDRRDADRIRGHKSDEIADILGYAGRAALIHRDDMVIDRKTTANPG